MILEALSLPLSLDIARSTAMFKRLLFGNEEEKLAFKTSSSSGIARLYSSPQPIEVPPREASYWRSFTTAFDTASDVFGLFAVSDVRRALTMGDAGRENIRTLVQVCVWHLESLRDDVDFCPEPTTSAGGAGRWGAALGAARSTTGAARGAGEERDRVKEALNCLRILTRVLPVVMEGDHDASCNVEAQGGADPSASLTSDDFERDLLWMRKVDKREEANLSTNPLSGRPEDEEGSRQFVIDDDDEDTEDAGDPLSAAGRKEAQEQEQQRQLSREEEEGENLSPSLGERLLTLVFDLLFYSGFTIPWTDEQLSQANGTSAAPRIHYAIWERGVGSSVDLANTTRQHEAHRVEVLRLLLVLLSKSIYVPAHLQTTTDNPALRLAATGLDRSVVLPLLCSLLNVGLKANDQGWLGNLASLPAGLVKERGAISPEETRLNLVCLSLQSLDVLLGYDSIDPQSQVKEASQEQVRPRLGTNASSQSISSARQPVLPAHEGAPMNLFRFYLTKLHRHADFLTLSDGIFSILASRGSGGLSSLPGVGSLAGGSTATIDPSGPHVSEALMLLWRLLSHNTKFRTFLLDDGARSPTLLSHLLYHALANKDSLPKQGLVRLCAFMLQDVSAERAFGIHISKAGSGAKARIHNGHKWGVAQGGGSSLSGGGTGGASSMVPSVVGGGGGGAGAVVGGGPSQATTGADILIQSVYSLIATTRGTLTSLYAPLVISLGNTAPFWRNLSILSSNRLVALLSSFTASSFLLADDGNPRLVFYLLESINAVLHHGYAHNPNFVYALVRGAQPSVQRLATFTLRKGIADIRRTRKRAGVYSSPSNATSASSLGRRPSSVAGAGGGENGLDRSPRADRKDPIGSEAGVTASTEHEEAPPEPASAEQSEKARGKMRRRSNADTAPALGVASLLGGQAEDEEDALVAGFNDEELHEAARTVGRHGFVPTTGWVQSWQVGLPLDSLQIALTELVPKVEELCSSGGLSSKSDADERVLAFLREQTLVGVLPSPPSISE